MENFDDRNQAIDFNFISCYTFITIYSLIKRRIDIE